MSWGLCGETEVEWIEERVGGGFGSGRRGGIVGGLHLEYTVRIAGDAFPSNSLPRGIPPRNLLLPPPLVTRRKTEKILLFGYYYADDMVIQLKQVSLSSLRPYLNCSFYIFQICLLIQTQSCISRHSSSYFKALCPYFTVFYQHCSHWLSFLDVRRYWAVGHSWRDSGSRRIQGNVENAFEIVIHFYWKSEMHLWVEYFWKF